MCACIRRQRRRRKSASVKLNWASNLHTSGTGVYDRRLTPAASMQHSTSAVPAMSLGGYLVHSSTSEACSCVLGGYFDSSSDQDDVWMQSSSAEGESSSTSSTNHRINHINTASAATTNGSTVEVLLFFK